jgi:uncharacterized pyridoxal phosphate-containing UPF0001 family protein
MAAVVTGPALDQVASRLEAVRARIAAVAGAGTVEVMAVTKGFGPDAVAAAAAAGCGAIGENYAQDLLTKTEAIAAARVEVYFIGQLQTNKVRALVDVVDVWASVDRLRLVAELARRAPGARVLVQVDATGEPGKGGSPVAEVAGLVAAAADAGLRVEGLMTVGPTDGDPVRTTEAFRTTRRLVELAVAAGSTQVRLGTALFGPRSTRPPVSQDQG